MPANRNPGMTLAPVAEVRSGAGYERYFRGALDRLHSERRYRVFADIERISGRFPTAKWRRPEAPRPRSPCGARMTTSAWASTRTWSAR